MLSETRGARAMHLAISLRSAIVNRRDGAYLLLSFVSRRRRRFPSLSFSRMQIHRITANRRFLSFTDSQASPVTAKRSNEFRAAAPGAAHVPMGSHFSANSRSIVLFLRRDHRLSIIPLPGQKPERATMPLMRPVTQSRRRTLSVIIPSNDVVHLRENISGFLPYHRAFRPKVRRRQAELGKRCSRFNSFPISLSLTL